MMGRQGSDQASLFYEFRLEDRIPKDTASTISSTSRMQ
jgi:hypothetical protein